MIAIVQGQPDSVPAIEREHRGQDEQAQAVQGKRQPGDRPAGTGSHSR